MNSILFWNEVAMDANKQAHTDGKDTGTLGPTLSSRAFAIVHLAMYDAYAAVRRSQGASGDNVEPYMAVPAPPAGAVALEAAAGAAFTALVALYPSQKDSFEDKKDDAGIPKGDEPGASFKYGKKVAEQLLALRRFDPVASDTFYQVGLEHGRHRVDPDNPGQGFHGPRYGALSRGFAITDRHVLDAPPFRSGSNYVAAYVAALEQVREKGIKPELVGTLPAGSSPRTPTETVIGIYWGYDGAANLGTPPRLYNQIVREVAKERSPGDNDAHARLFALVNAAMGDAGVLAWDQKYMHDFWRPVVGIREHDPSLGPDRDNPAGENLLAGSDTGWLPLGAPKSNSAVPGEPPAKNFSPNFPAYPSGHATFGSAALQMARLFYNVKDERGKDNLLQSFVSEEFNGETTDNTGAVRPRHNRKFSGGLWDMILENGFSRVLLGVHWVFDAFAVKKNGEPDLSRNVGGVPLGLKIAEDIWNKGKGLKLSKVGPREDFPSSFKA